MSVPLVTSAVRRSPFFYGWLIVMVSFLVSMTHDVVHSQVLSIFLKPMSQEFGWGRTAISGALSLSAIVGGLLAMSVGPLVDRRGPRMITTVSLVLIAASTAALATIGTLWQFYLFFVFSRVMSGVAGMGTGVAVVNWFIRKRGRAVAVSNLGSRAGLVFIPIAIQLVVGAHGWQWGWTVLGLGVLLLVVLPSVLFLRRRPEDMGLKPDGIRDEVTDPPAPGQPVQSTQQQEQSQPEPVWSLAQAVRTRSFWLLNIAQSFFVMTAQGLGLHQLAYLTDAGIGATTAATVLSIQATAGVVGLMAAGFMAERLPARYLMMIIYVGLAAATVFLTTVASAPAAYLYAVAFGFFQGASLTSMQIIWPDYYGRFSIGAIRGAGSPISAVATASGPLLAGILYDTTGSYKIGFGIFAGALASAALMVVLATPPKHRPRKRSSRLRKPLFRAASQK